MPKLFRALIALVILLLAFFLPLHFRIIPDWSGGPNWLRIIWAGLLNTILAYGVSLLFSSKLPLLRRFGTAWLVVVGLTYLVPGLLGFVSTSLIEVGLWSALISPYLPYSLVHAMKQSGRWAIAASHVEIMPGQFAGWESRDTHYGYAAAVVAVSVIAIVAAFAMAKSRKAGYWIWLALLGLSLAFLSGYVIVADVGWGFRAITIQLCWEASYIAAFLLARIGADLKEPSPLIDAEEFTRLSL